VRRAPALSHEEKFMNNATIATPSRGNPLRRALLAGFAFFLAKGCAWLAAVVLVHDLL
jgi:hypothetical protein